ncbi:MAG: ACT domain-containing protein [Myxococcales bacterium]|nr:ACT domain-containing protein [Myxococcales bacterium]
MSDAKREVEELRKEIEDLDRDLLGLLDKRARAARRLGDLRRHQAAILPLADHAALRSLLAHATGDMPEAALRDIFREVFAACLPLELPVKVAYVGPEGGAGYVAARARFGAGSTLLAAESTSAALEEVSRRRAAFAVVPFETSIEGPVEQTVTAMAASDLRIAEMLDITFDLHVLNRSGRAADVQRVYATPADHAACERSLASQPTRPAIVEAKTPLAACELAAADEQAGAIGSEVLGTQLGLEIAQRSIRDRRGDRVRYSVIGPRPSGRTGQDVTSLVFTVRDAAGSLLDVLRVLAERGINLTNIHSHPVRGETWSYLFYVELSGHFTDRPLVTAFEEMKRLTRSFKVLGSYPAP